MTLQKDKICVQLSEYAYCDVDEIKENIENNIPGMEFVSYFKAEGSVTTLVDTRAFISKITSTNEIFLAFRGTASIWDFVTDARSIVATQFVDASGVAPPNGGEVGSGFLAGWQIVSTNDDPAKNILKKLEEVIQSMGGKDITINVTGHSLGAALATISIYDVWDAVKRFENTKLCMVNFAAPIVGTDEFASLYEKIDNGNVFDQTTMYLREGDPIEKANDLLQIPDIFGENAFVYITHRVMLPQCGCRLLACHRISGYVKILLS